MRRRLGGIAIIAAALGVPALAHAQAGAAAAPAAAPAAPSTPVLEGAGGAVSVSTEAQAADGRPRLGGALSYVAQPAGGVTTRLDLNLKAGQTTDGVLWPGATADAARPWSDVGVGLRADWAAAHNAALALSLSDRVVTRPVAGPEGATPTGTGVVADAPRDARTEQGAALTATLKPVDPVSFTLGGEVRAASDDLDLPADEGGRATLRIRDGSASAAVAWTLAPAVKLQASARATTSEVAWTEGASAAQSYAAVTPDVAAVVTPWADGALTLGVSRAVTPLDAAKFVTLARASASDAAAADLRPDQEWRMQARFTQALPGAARLELALLQARLDSTTELIRIGADGEAPGSVAGGSRRQVDLAFDLPLRMAGLNSLALQTRNVWRASQITDPVTGASRRLSGEAPYETSLALVQTLPVQGLTWGLNTRDQGDQSFYGVNQLSSVETTRSLGAFVEYRPAEFALRLQLDDLAGGERRWTDAWYVDGRDTGALQRTDRRQEGGPGFTFSLRRPL